jgi:hypothetical protein
MMKVQVSPELYFIFANKSQGTLRVGFTKVCEIVADLSNMVGALEEAKGPQGVYWKVKFEIGILFGSTELKAKLFWNASDVRIVIPVLYNRADISGRAVHVRVRLQLFPSNSHDYL